MTTGYERVLGSMAGAVIGDAMGTATETMTPRRIVEVYGRLDELVAPDYSPFSSGRPAGHCSDDSRQMLLLAERFANTGEVTIEQVIDSILVFASDPVMMERNTGPTTRVVIQRLLAGDDPMVIGRGDPYHFTGVSNGASTKAGPAGWLNPGNIVAAVKDVGVICAPSHNTTVALSGAAAVAGGIAAAMVGATIDEVIGAAIDASRLGIELGLEVGREAAGASVEARILLAVEIARAADNMIDAGAQIGRIIGGGIQTTEAVPAAFGLFAAAKGDPYQGIVGAVNLGDDTDTVACVTGMLCGSYAGIDAVPAHWVQTVSEVNDLDLPALARAVSDRGSTRFAITLTETKE
ncbi:N/A [soil metagenome]